MNISPTCERKRVNTWEFGAPPIICEKRAEWVVIDKTTGKIEYRCDSCEQLKIKGHTYSVFPAKDYSKKANNG